MSASTGSAARARPATGTAASMSTKANVVRLNIVESRRLEVVGQASRLSPESEAGGRRSEVRSKVTVWHNAASTRQMSKSEIRMTNECRMTKVKVSKRTFHHSCFVIHSSLGFRHSSLDHGLW